MTGQQNPRQSDCESGPIPGSNPGACPECGGWRYAGVIHRCEDTPPDLMAALLASLEPLGTCVVHGDYWTDDCTRCGR